ncbi:4'-phosphopantetheinyl transferase superfamily protein [Streptomyces sp. NPDC058667]|uniref:4'-phosphopantetheinyl transferase superfamily protein n=1 Tax=Streptomyces sp. NPDC058667 TaxID=3346588 RepID=UPI00364FD570
MLSRDGGARGGGPRPWGGPRGGPPAPRARAGTPPAGGARARPRARGGGPPSTPARGAAARRGGGGAHFARLWTRKEAYLKALGTGLSRHPRIDYLGSDLRRRPARWAVLDLPAGPGHAAAIAVPGDRPEHVTVRRLTAEPPYGDAGQATDPGSTITRSSR